MDSSSDSVFDEGEERSSFNEHSKKNTSLTLAEISKKKAGALKNAESVTVSQLPNKSSDKRPVIAAFPHAVDKCSGAAKTLTVNTDLPRFCSDFVGTAVEIETNLEKADPDYSGVLWSYLDPAGNIQGTFSFVSIEKYEMALICKLKDHFLPHLCSRGSISGILQMTYG